jgi:single-stranded-DNA-specific exonuclease
MADGTVIRATRIQRREVPDALYRALPDALDPVMRRIYAARRVEPAGLSATLSALLPVGSLGGVAAAADVLVAARRRQAPVLVVGDYDADGATATALVVGSLRAMGYADVSYLVPNRFEFGYGFSPGVAALAAARRPGVIITVDNGVTSIEGVAAAAALGIDVIVTDHHLPGAELPAARAILNPNLPGEAFPSKALCGVGVAFYLLAALAKALDAAGLGRYEALRAPVLAGLDLVALGTVADLVPLDANNRILVGEGLRRIRAGRARPGLAALFAVAGRDTAVARSADLGFAIAPRLNAAGRLTDMSLGIDCLLAGDARRAAELAARLDELNAERRELQARMQSDAEEHLGRLDDAALDGGHGLCLLDDSWHEGIVGLVASRMKERTGRPVIAFAPGEESGILKGSARSVDGVHIRDVLAAVAARDVAPGLRFGGHAMAAGLRLPVAEFDAFRAAFDAELGRELSGRDTGRVLWTDGPLAPGDMTVELAEHLHLAGPWGQGFPEPLFDNEFTVLDQRVLKDAHLRLSLRHLDGGEPVEAIAFNQAGSGPLPGRARCCYRLGINDFGGRRRRQLVVEHIQSE